MRGRLIKKRAGAKVIGRGRLVKKPTKIKRIKRKRTNPRAILVRKRNILGRFT